MARRRRSFEEIQNIVGEARRLGLTQSEIAEREGVHDNTVGRWVREVREHAEDETTLVAVRVTGPNGSLPEQDARRVELTIERAFVERDVHLALPSDVDSGDLERLLGVIGTFTC